MSKSEEHKITVSKIFLLGGYSVKCSRCGKLGKGTDKNKNAAWYKAWRIGDKHRANKNGVPWIGG
jgi:hypothetical protein